jgi:hypothetical protein
VYAVAPGGFRPVAAAYQRLLDHVRVDAVVLVDGGTDILMQGDEAGLGTPAEDITSLLAAATLDVPTKLVVSLGFGIDAYHGVCHAHVLENLAALAGAYLGALSIPRESPEAAAYLDAVAHAELHTTVRPSIVHGQISAALRGEFGDVSVNARTAGSELFVNPLMAVMFTVQLDALAAKVQYAPDLMATDRLRQVVLVIENHRSVSPRRPRRPLPF